MWQLIKIENHGYQELYLYNKEDDCIILGIDSKDYDLVIISRETIPQFIELLQKEVKTTNPILD